MEQSIRREKIVEHLKQQNISNTKELAYKLNVSEMTIRRDIAILERDNIINSFYGGISLNTNNTKFNSSGYNIETVYNENAQEKKRIAKMAASLISLNDVILIDTGSTTESIIDYIPEESINIVYCYALNIMIRACAKPNLKVVACGGYFHRDTSMFESQEGASLIQKTLINKSFMAARGISEEIGITTAEPYEVEIKKAALSVSEKKILLADSSKFGKAWYAKYADLKDFDLIISDTNLLPQSIEMIKDNGVELILA